MVHNLRRCSTDQFHHVIDVFIHGQGPIGSAPPLIGQLRAFDNMQGMQLEPVHPKLQNTVERSVYRETDPGKLITRIAFDPFDSPFQPQAAPTASKPLARQKRPPLLPMRLTERLEETEKEFLRAALEKSRFNQTMAAELLNLSYHQFRGKLRKYGISAQPQP